MERDHLKMMQTPNRWPVWPYLPLKKPDSKPGRWPDLAVVMGAAEVSKLRLYELPHPLTLWTADFSTLPFEILTPEEILQRGWEVD